MQWIELSTTTDSSSVEKIASVLGRYGQGGATIEEIQSDVNQEKTLVVKIYIPHGHSYKLIRKEIEQNFSLIPGFTTVQLEERILKPENWLDSLKKHFGVIEIGEKFIVKPSWIQQTLPDSTRTVIELDPGTAFGTGLHPTTRLCMLSLEQYLKVGMTVLDLGTGSGILAIAAAKLDAAAVLAIDIDPVAVKAARHNIKINGVEGRVRVRRGTLGSRIQKEYRKPFDLILANITARAISDSTQDFSRALKTRGRIITSGIHSQGLDEVLVSLALADFTIETISQQDEWYAVIAVNN